MRKVARVNPRFVADPLDRVRDIGFLAFATDKNAPGVDVACDVLAHFLLRAQIEKPLARIVLDVGFPRAVESLKTNEQPGNAALQETELHLGKFIEDTVENHAAKRNHLAEWVT